MFWELSNSREHGFGGPQPISLSEIWAYCQLYGIDTLDERHRLIRYLQRLDASYMESLPKADAKTES